MVEIEMEGSKEEVESFMYELYRSPSVRVLDQHIEIKIVDNKVHHCVRCTLRSLPDRRKNLIRIIDTNGIRFDFEMFDLVQANVVEDVKVYTGRSIDFFSVIRKENEAYELWKKLKASFYEHS
ncbi:hypothetical protein [Thermoactinomyces sp. DSM 45892]|uniref:hypothetical protein n=1 Tax=Thermoactinomyces sp. DSM 45892 TaxID=1882753 RepID=UPI000896F5D7|nr:hypothetical protein [Thermoactinomyces sp. DSM 45892]SDZ01279.1 hypothetical protein SAMN05444416_111122 [Thermoactinomyces sp. DSM 45892]